MAGTSGGQTRLKDRIKSTSNESIPDDEAWECDTCHVSYTDKKSKMLECDYCHARRCIKCLKIPESVYKSLGSRPDFPWFCTGCLEKAMRCIKEERGIEERCETFLEGFRKEVNSKLEQMQAEIQVIKKTVSEKSEKDETAEQSKEEIVNKVCSNMSDKLARQKNIVIFNLPESTSILKADVIKQDRAHVAEISSLTAGITDFEFSTRRLGKKEPEPNQGGEKDKQGEESKPKFRPLLVTFENEENKVKIMKNCYKLCEAKSPYNAIGVKHDMTVREREVDKKLQEEAKEQNKSVAEEDFIYVVRGLPWDRKVVKIRKKPKNNPNPASDSL